MSETSISVPTNRRVDLEEDRLSITVTDADLSPIYASLTNNLALIGDNTNSITSLRNDLTSNVALITANQGSITQVAADLANNVLSISSLTGSISTINGSLSAHQSSLSSHALSLSAHETAINDLDTNLGDVTGSVINNAINIGSLSTSCSALSSDLGDVTSTVISNSLKIGSLTTAVDLNTGSITTLTNRLDNLSYTDLNGSLPNADVAVKELGADKTYYNTAAKVPIGGSSYPTDSLGLELDYQNRNFFDIISSTYALASMASSLNTLIGDPLEITSIAAIQAEQIVQNGRLFDLDAPTTGRVSVNEDAISTLSSRVSAVESRTNGLDRVGTISTISGDLSITGSIVNSGYTYLEDSVGVLQGKTTEISYDDVNTITSITNNVYVGNNITIGGSITNTGFQAVETRTTDLGYNSGTTTIFGTLSVDHIINPELQNATTDIDDLETKTQNITSSGVNQTTITGQLKADEVTCDTLAFGDPPTFLSDLKTKLTDISFAALTTTVANTLNAGTIINPELQNATTDIDDLETKTQNITSSGVDQTTVSGTLSAGMVRVNNGNINPSLYLGTISADATFGGFIYTRAIIHEQENGQSPAAITFGNGASLGNDQISLITNGARRIYITNSAVELFSPLTATSIYATTYNNLPDFDADKITSGTLDVARIPDLNASKITSGTLDVARIPNLDVSKITSGNSLSLYGQAIGVSQIDAELRFVMNSVDGWKLYSDASASFNLKIEDLLSGARRLEIDNNGRFTFNVGRGDVYFEDNANDDTDGAGLTLRTSSNPTNSGGSIFCVRSSGQAARLWVGQDITSVPNNKFGAGNYTGGTGNEGTISNYSFQIDASSGDVDMTDGRMSVRYNTDTAHFFGRAYLGYDDYNFDVANFGHIDYRNENEFALRQDFNGTTWLNTAGTYIYFAKDGNITNRIYRDTATSTTRFYIYGVPAAAYSSTLRTTSDATGYICRQTSSRETKMDIEDVWDSLVDNVIDNLRPVWFRYRPEILTSHEYQKDFSDVGLVAEDVFEVEPRLAHLDENKKPYDVAYDKIGVWCLSYIQRLKKQVASLEAKNAELESKIASILGRLDAAQI